MNNAKSLQRLKDTKFYLENFCKIRGKVPGKLVPFILNEAQKDLYNAVRRNNRVMILKARQIGFCLHPEMRILTADLRWVKLKDIKIGEKVISTNEKISGGKCSERRLNTSVVEKKWVVREKALMVRFHNGEKLVLTGEHRMLCKSSREIIWKKAKDFEIGDFVRFITRPWKESELEDYWFGGMIDGEGTIRNIKRRVNIAVYQTEGLVSDRIRMYVKSRGYSCCETVNERNGKKMIIFTFCKMQELFRLLGQCRPTRFLQSNWWNGRKLPHNGWGRIESIESLSDMEMIDLQTSEKTFIVEGFVSHNSTAMTGFFYHDTIFNPGTVTALIGYNSDLTAELLDKVKTFYKTTPASLRPTIHYNSKYEISFPRIDSKILVLPSTENVGRGYTLNNVLATELSAWDKAEEKMMTLEASVPIHGRMVIESTPRGQGNLYHRMWMAEDNGYAKKEYGWWWGYSREDIEVIRKRMNNPMKFAQEYGLEFLASGRSVFDQEMIIFQRENIWRLGECIIEPDGLRYFVNERDKLRIYKMPEKDGIYVCGVDVSEGVEGGDYSVATIWDRRTGEEVAMFRGLLAPDILGSKLNDWGRTYNNALMVVEVNNHGLTTLVALKNLQYPSLYFRPAKFETLGTPSSDKFGWRTTKITRPLLIDDFAQAVRDNLLTIHSKELLDEMSVFVYDDKGDMVPQAGFHDDCIFSAAIGFQGFKTMYNKPLEQLNYERHLPVNFAY